MFDIITVGSATVDLFVKTRSKFKILKKKEEHDICYPIGSKILIDELSHSTGGGGTNTAVAFSRLGLKTGWIGKLGTGPNSRFIKEDIQKEKVAFLGHIGKGEAGHSTIIVGLEKDRTILAYKGINDKLKPSEVNLKKLKTKWFYLSSMIGQSFKTSEKVALFAKKNKIKYAFNPSSYLAKRGLKYLRNIVKGCDVLILNKEEAKALTKRNKPINWLLKELQKYSKLVVITDGKKGAYAYNGITKYIVIPKKIKVIETTGAGDSFASGLVAGIIIKKDLEYALKLGAAQANSVIQHIGAKNNLLTRNKANALAKKAAKIKKVAL